MKTKNNLAIAIIIIIISITSVYPSNKVAQNNPISDTVFNHQESKLKNTITLSSNIKINESLFKKRYRKDLKKSNLVAINKRI